MFDDVTMNLGDLLGPAVFLMSLLVAVTVMPLVVNSILHNKRHPEDKDTVRAMFFSVLSLVPPLGACAIYGLSHIAAWAWMPLILSSTGFAMMALESWFGWHAPTDDQTEGSFPPEQQVAPQSIALTENTMEGDEAQWLPPTQEQDLVETKHPFYHVEDFL